MQDPTKDRQRRIHERLAEIDPLLYEDAPKHSPRSSGSSIEWATPPPSRAASEGVIFTAELRDALRARPGEWACVVRSHKSASAALQFAKRNPEFEATSRQNPDKTFDLYVRFVGEQS